MPVTSNPQFPPGMVAFYVPDSDPPGLICLLNVLCPESHAWLPTLHPMAQSSMQVWFQTQQPTAFIREKGRTVNRQLTTFEHIFHSAAIPAKIILVLSALLRDTTCKEHPRFKLNWEKELGT